MEPSKMFGSEEECHSSESGWTMYIGSPTYDDGDAEDRDNGDDEGTIQVNDLEEDHESDDSMASDASSRPWGNGFPDFLQVAGEENFDKKEKKIQEKHIEGKREEKKEKVIIDSKGKAPVQGNGKVRKNYLVGKTK